MFKPTAFVLVLMIAIAIIPSPGQREASATNAAPTNTRLALKNKFVGRWSSQITYSSGEVVDDGVFYISDGTEAVTDEVSVLHSLHGGPVIGYTMSYPDRIEIQISLGGDRVAHYNGVLTSPTRIEGRYFVTGRPQSHHRRAHLRGNWSEAGSITPDEDGSFQAQAGGG